jgi:hypothetical protein
MAPDGVVPVNPGSPIGTGLTPPSLPTGVVPKNPGTSLGTGLTTPSLASSVAMDKMDQKAGQLGAVAGASLVAGLAGVIDVQGGFRRLYERGTMYMRTGGTPFFLNQVTAHRYDILGNTGSFLGFPVSDTELDPRDQGAGLTRFEQGTIYFWADLGAIELQQVSVRYLGFHCFGETGEFSASDEPYFAFGVLPMNVDQRATLRTRIYEDVDAGESVADEIELYRGDPTGVVISVNLAEHDEGDPEAYKEHVDEAVDKAADGVTAALGEIPAAGPAFAFIAQVAFFIVGPDLKRRVNELLGTDDDHVGSVDVMLSTRDLVQLTRTLSQSFEGLFAQFESPLISGDGASYKAYFEVQSVPF